MLCVIKVSAIYLFIKDLGVVVSKRNFSRIFLEGIKTANSELWTIVYMFLH